MLIKSGVEVGIITGRSSPAVKKRAEALGIKYLIMGQEAKLEALDEIKRESGFDNHDIAFMGDDYPDLPVMMSVAASFSVPNAHEELLARASYVTHKKGGEGAVREVCDALLKAQNQYDAALAPYLV